MIQINKLKAITGALTFIYCIIPIIQDKTFSSFSDRFNDHYVFFLSSAVYGFMQMFYTNSIATYIVQVVLWLLLWGFSYFVIRLFR